MAMDGLMIYSITKQLQSFVPCKINKIQNISDEELLLNLHTRDHGNQRLVLNAHSNTNRIYLTTRLQANQNAPSNFVMVLRKKIGQGIIEQIEQKNFDRIICFHITNRNELGDIVKYQFYVELMGKYANMILVDDQGIIIDALKRIPVYENSKRFIHPGAKYTLPAQPEKQDPLCATNINPDQSLVQQVYGFSPILSKEFLCRMHNQEAFQDIIKELLQSETLYIYEKEYHCIALKHLGQEAKEYPFMEGLDHLYETNEQKNRIKEQCGDVIRVVEKELQKHIKKLPKLEKNLEESMNFSKYQHYGDLLFAYMYQIQKEPIVHLPSFEDGSDVAIPLDMRLDIKQNANKFYQKYHKMKRSQTILEEQIQQCKEDIDYYQQLQEQLNHVSINDAQEIKEELINNRVMMQKKKVQKKKKQKPNIIHLSFEDADIYVGKNNLQNNYITHHLARKYDTWFHVKDYHGSHVLLKTDNVNEDYIRMCAQLAAYYSKGKDSSSVPVDYCPVSQLKKVPGSKVGFVTMKSYNTIYIDPDSNQIEEWIKKAEKK